MDSRSVPAHRTSPEALFPAIQAIATDPVVSSLLGCVGGMLAILDENRQILATNPQLLELLGLDAGECLGLRPGEALECVHAAESSEGCGTTRWCRTCGAALAIIASQRDGRSCERDCVLVKTDGSDLFLRVRCAPLERDGKALTAIFLRDISKEQMLHVLERAFFHDIRGLVTGVVGCADLLMEGASPQARRKLGALQDAALRLAQEVELQGRLVHEEAISTWTSQGDVRAEDLLRELRDLFEEAPFRRGIEIEVRGDLPSRLLRTDGGLVMRVLRNMLTNALEASRPGETVTVTCREAREDIRFEVHNVTSIPPDVQLRVFQRNFSTKPGCGRGLGTWSMRFFGEEMLGGKVSFSSSASEGTVFRLQIKA